MDKTVNNEIYQIKDLTFSYKKSLILLNRCNLNLGHGELVGLVGKNGTGKSTFLKILSGIIKNYQGKILFHNSDLKMQNAKSIAKNLSYMCQLSSLDIPLTIRQIVSLGQYACNIADNDKTEKVINNCGLVSLADESFNKLSGGWQQKTMLARAICQNGDVLLLDEPTANLDILAKKEILNILSNLVDNNKSLVVFCSHDIELIKHYATRIIYILNGELHSVKPTELDEHLINKIFR